MSFKEWSSDPDYMTDGQLRREIKKSTPDRAATLRSILAGRSQENKDKIKQDRIRFLTKRMAELRRGIRELQQSMQNSRQSIGKAIPEDAYSLKEMEKELLKIQKEMDTLI